MQRFTLAAAALAVTFSSSGFAAGSNFYASISAGDADNDMGIGTSADYIVDDSDLAYGLSVGYRINRYFAIEAGYQDLGESSVIGTGTGGAGPGFGGSGNTFGDNTRLRGDDASLYTDTSGFTLGAAASYPVNNQLDVYAKAGVFVWDTDYDYDGDVTIGGVDLTGPGSVSDDGSDIYYGIGGRMHYNKRVSVGMEWVRYEAHTSVDVIGGSMLVNF